MAPAATPAPAPEVRNALRNLLGASAEFNALDAGSRREIAHSLVRISHTARALADQAGDDSRHSVPAASRRPLAAGQSAGSEFSGTAVDRVAAATRNILGAISFPRFVNELITGVFKALIDSNQQQLQSFVELIRNVAASTGDFADANVGAVGARAWLAERFPASFEVRGDDDASPEELQEMTPEERREHEAERERSTKLVLRAGASMPADGALKGALGMRPDETLPGGGPENLVSYARQAMARNRQQVLSTMVMMGLQRIVVESGRLNASMRFHIDARSAAAEDRGSSFDIRNETSASGSLGFGPWGMNAQMKNTIGYVSTQNVSTTEELNASADLNSSVELFFRSDYVPLTRLAGVEEVDRIRVNTINPSEEARLAESASRERTTAQRTAEEGRRTGLQTRLTARPPLPEAPPMPAPPSASGAGGGGSGAGASGAPNRPPAERGTGAIGDGASGSGSGGGTAARQAESGGARAAAGAAPPSGSGTASGGVLAAGSDPSAARSSSTAGRPQEGLSGGGTSAGTTPP